MFKLRFCASAIVILMIALCISASAFTGSINNLVNGGIDTQNNWDNGVTSISWVVTYDSGLWNYHYTMVVPKTDISHFILEVSPNFTSDLIQNLVVHQGGIGSYSVSTFLAPPPGNPEQQPNPYMPADVYGIKFDDTSGLVLEFSFDCERMPVWGDFYVKGGTKHVAYNTGFAAIDPTVPAADGSYEGHILVPDTVVPEPGSLVAFASGLIGFVGLVTRRRTR